MEARPWDDNEDVGSIFSKLVSNLSISLSGLKKQQKVGKYL
jgi:hypothetical protein